MNDSAATFSGDYFNTEHLKSGMKRKAVRGAGAVVFSQILVYGIQMLGTLVLARLLTPGDFGLVAMVTAFSMLLQNFGIVGFTEAIIQKDEINHKQISTLFWINLLISLLLTVIFVFSAPLIVWFYKKSELKLITIITAFGFIFNCLATQHLALLRRNMRFYSITANDIIAATISVLLAIALAWWGWGYWALVVKCVSLPFITAIGAWIICKWRPGLPALGTGVSSMVKFGINAFSSYSLYYFSRNLDKVLIGWYHGTISLGNYDRAYHLFVLPANQLSHPLTSVAVATLSRLKNDPEKFKRYYLKAVSILAFIGMALSAMLALIGNDLILLALGPQWDTAGKIFSVFGPCIGIMLIYFTNGWLHLSLGRPDRWFRWNIVAFIVTAISFVIGLPFGPLGVAVGYTISFYVLIFPNLLYAGKPINLEFLSIVSVIWKYLASALVSGLLCWYILYSLDITSNFFIGLSISARLLLSSIFCIIMYLMLIIMLYKNTRPISEFFSTVREMVPKVLTNK